MIALVGLAPLFALLALGAFGLALWLAFRGAYLGAFCAAVIAVLILLYGT